MFVSFNYRISVFGFLSHQLLESDENDVFEAENDEGELEPQYLITESSENFNDSENSDFEEEKLAKLFSSYWANFAHSGNPNGDNLPTWLPITMEVPKQLTIADKSVSMKKKHKF